MACNKPSYEFLETVRSRVKGNGKTPGVLVTHNAFTFHFCHWGRDKITGYYECSMRKSGCSASAIISKLSLTNSATGAVEERFLLTKWNEVDGHNHCGDKAGIIAEKSNS